MTESQALLEGLFDYCSPMLSDCRQTRPGLVTILAALLCPDGKIRGRNLRERMAAEINMGTGEVIELARTGH